MKGLKIASIILVVMLALLVILNQFLWSHSYVYACWRVSHPFGLNADAFSNVVSKTEPTHIPVLITKIDGPDGWWIESMFNAWFPEARPPETKKKVYWTQWWKDHQMEHASSLILHHDPQF